MNDVPVRFEIAHRHRSSFTDHLTFTFGGNAQEPSGKTHVLCAPRAKGFDRLRQKRDGGEHCRDVSEQINHGWTGSVPGERAHP